MKTSRLTRLIKRLDADPSPPPDNGVRWPTPLQGVLWDLLPGAHAPASDGVVGPTWSPPAWVAAAADTDLDDLLEVERRRLDAVQASAATTEGKASRLLGTTVTLLAAAVALAALQLRASTHANSWTRGLLVVAAVPAAAAAGMLTLAAVRGLDADTRVGLYGTVTGKQRAEQGKRGELEATVLAAALSAWSAGHKASSLMDARAWFTRGLLTALVGLLLAAVTVATR